ncbi:MAG: outer membrane beta-barrel protein [Candidatus Cloacimonadales bacterium]|nr:outer membrane beta-barrel protein [Candidatus Cloacimonadales bacterium]
MKKTLIVFLLVLGLFASSLLAQNKSMLVGGVNFGSISYNDKDIADMVDVSSKLGFNVGLEAAAGPLKFGVSYIQRGSTVKVSDYDYKGWEIYNYITGYALIPIPLSKQFSLLGGMQVGKCLGGKWEADMYGESDSGTLDAEDFNIDFGIVVGADIMFSPKVGARASYYYGLSDVAKDIDSNDNYKNNGFGINLLFAL